MRIFVFRVDDVFQISGRGCVVTPGIPKAGDFRLKVGDALLLRRLDGSELRTFLRGIEMGGSPDYPGIPILLGAEVTKEQVPAGTEVWTT
jgi:translation elongation factor EF-Tu-like GTPase